MAWDTKANVRGPAGYNATGAAEDDQAIADFIASNVGVTKTSAALDNAGAARLKDPASKTGAVLAASIGAGIAGLTVQDLTGVLPTFTRLNGGAPIFSQAAQNLVAGKTGSTSIYFPSIVDARALFGPAALDAFYMYYSTDHTENHTDSGIWLSTAPSEIGPWTGRGRVFRDDTGTSWGTETPTVYKDPTGATKAIMLYQQGGVAGAIGVQTTMYATSNDGVAWTVGGIAIDILPGQSGDGHTGYVHTTQMGNQIFGHGLRGGGDFPHFTLTVSDDGRKFRHLQMLGYGKDQMSDGRRIEWNSGDVVRWRGQLLWIGVVSNQVSGSNPKDARLAIAPITPDLSKLIGTPKYILYPTAGTETTDYRSTRALVTKDGRLILYYQVGNRFYISEGL